jgi:hypothetical protein
MSTPKTMTVVFVKTSGNVLAAVTQAAKATDGLSAASLAGEGLPVRKVWNLRKTPPLAEVFGGSYLIPNDALDIAEVPLDPEVLFLPRSFVYDPVRKALAPPPTLGAIDTSVHAFTATRLTVRLTGAAPVDTPVWIQVSGGALTPPFSTEGMIPKNNTDLVVDHDTFSPATYSILIFALGYLPNSISKTLP